MLFGHEADAVFDAEKVIVEIDSWDTHKSFKSFKSDRRRDAAAAEHGYLTVRLISDLLAADPYGEAESLRHTLAHRRNR
jgi:very-short-patch-repair endonuclease